MYLNDCCLITASQRRLLTGRIIIIRPRCTGRLSQNTSSIQDQQACKHICYCLTSNGNYTDMYYTLILLFSHIGCSINVSVPTVSRDQIVAHNMRIMTGKQISNITDKEYRAALHHYLLVGDEKGTPTTVWKLFLRDKITKQVEMYLPEYSRTMHFLNEIFAAILQRCDANKHRNLDNELYKACQINDTCFVVEVSINVRSSCLCCVKCDASW